MLALRKGGVTFNIHKMHVRQSKKSPS
jgi:hypothetical protein